MVVDGKKCAVNRDATGKLTVVSAVCTHMGCIVHWNDAETTWDCPCHGSRFTTDGEVIEGPAIAPLQKVEVL
jgi:Rieske Fe-S protein